MKRMAVAEVLDLQRRRTLGAGRRAPLDRRGGRFGDFRAQHQVDDLVAAPRASAVTPTVTPSRSTVARSQSAVTSAMRCEMNITLAPRSR